MVVSFLGGSACSSIVCSHGAKCLIDSNDLPRCYCPDQCDEYDRTISVEGRVCGSDNETYQTLCDLQKRSCQRQETLNVVHVGECRTFDFFSFLLSISKRKSFRLKIVNHIRLVQRHINRFVPVIYKNIQMNVK